MRRSELVRAAAACVVAGPAVLGSGRAQGASVLRMMIPANPGGGWDTTGRALAKALVEARAYESVAFENKGGAAGALGLAQFINARAGDPDALIVMGAVMVGGLVMSRAPVSLETLAPIARLTSEYNVFVVAADSPLRTMAEVVEQLKKDPASVKWGGGSRGSTEHIAACMLARSVGVDPKRVNYVPFRGGGEAAAILGGQVTVGGSGYSEFADHIAAGRMRPLGVTAERRLPGVQIPTLKEQRLDVVIGNWRGVYGAAQISDAQRSALVGRVAAAVKTKAWTEALQSNRWTPAYLAGEDFRRFVEYEFTAMRAITYLAGMS